MALPGFFAAAQAQLLKAIATWQTSAPPAAVIGKTRQLVMATIGLIVIVALPAILIFYARRRWRP